MRRLLPLALLFVFAACDSSDPTVADANDTVTIAYEGRLLNGTVFDSNPNATFSLRNTIPGFRNGVAGMTIGETKTFRVPPEEGYGGVSRPGIPANSTLEFTVTLIDIL